MLSRAGTVTPTARSAASTFPPVPSALGMFVFVWFKFPHPAPSHIGLLVAWSRQCFAADKFLQW